MRERGVRSKFCIKLFRPHVAIDSTETCFKTTYYFVFVNFAIIENGLHFSVLAAKEYLHTDQFYCPWYLSIIQVKNLPTKRLFVIFQGKYRQGLHLKLNIMKQTTSFLLLF